MMRIDNVTAEYYYFQLKDNRSLFENIEIADASAGFAIGLKMCPRGEMSQLQGSDLEV